MRVLHDDRRAALGHLSVREEVYGLLTVIADVHVVVRVDGNVGQERRTRRARKYRRVEPIDERARVVKDLHARGARFAARLGDRRVDVPLRIRRESLGESVSRLEAFGLRRFAVLN